MRLTVKLRQIRVRRTDEMGGMNIDKLREDTPGCADVMHFNNAGASLMPRPVLDTVVQHLELENRIGGYEAEWQAADGLKDFYTEFARLLNAKPAEIAYVENATRAWDMAFYAIPFQPGDRVITHASEYSSNYLALLQQAKRLDIHIDLAPSDASGQVDVRGLEALIRDNTRLVAITHVPTQGGLVNPAESIGDVARRHELQYLLDACQSAGQIDLDVERIGCDLLSGTGRKFLRGPRGTGFLYVSSKCMETLEPPFIDMRAANWTAPQDYRFADGARRFENWESYVAGKLGLASAARYANSLGLKAIEERVSGLAAELRGLLGDEHGVVVHDLGERRSGIVTFTRSGEEPAVTAQRLRRQGINVSVTDRLSAQLDFSERDIHSLVRASVHYYNTEEECVRFVRDLAERS